MLKTIIVNKWLIVLILTLTACSSNTISNKKKGEVMNTLQVNNITKTCSYTIGNEYYAFELINNNLRLWRNGKEIEPVHQESNSKNFKFERFKTKKIPYLFSSSDITNNLFKSNKINLNIKKYFLFIEDESIDSVMIFLVKSSDIQWIGHIIKYEIIDDLKEIEEKTLDKTIIFESCK